MILQSIIGLRSDENPNPYVNEFLPLITAPNSAILDEGNYQIYLDNKIHICLPEGVGYDGELEDMKKGVTFTTVSLETFTKIFAAIENFDPINHTPGEQICIEHPQSNDPELYTAIETAKQLYGDSLVIMASAGDSKQAFFELSKVGTDYIRVGVDKKKSFGPNVGVGQYGNNLEKLVVACVEERKYGQHMIPDLHNKEAIEKWKKNISKVKIVADGVTSYIKKCESEFGLNDNGYAAINTLLYAGADLVMIDELFVQCLESAGEKRIWHGEKVTSVERLNNSLAWDGIRINTIEEVLKVQKGPWLQVKYSGMITQQEQIKYKNNLDNPISIHWRNYREGLSDKPLKPDPNIKPSEGSVNWLPVRWTLNDWLYGSENPGSPLYLIGWVNSIKMAMRLTGLKTLQNLCKK